MIADFFKAISLHIDLSMPELFPLIYVPHNTHKYESYVSNRINHATVRHISPQVYAC